ncbi:MAG: FtsX-like permease family protein [Alistipes sp.]|nr:FtsX-like permease family protein [Alistipes sp.]
MRYSQVIYSRNIRYFARYYRLVALSVMVAVMVIVGSLVVGDSVRGTLRHQVEERLGNSETIIFANQSYLSDEILQEELLMDGCRGYLLSQGFISHNGRMIPVMVWGCDDEDLDYGVAKINSALAEELGNDNAEDIVLRLPAKGLIPSGSLFVTKNYTTSIRLKISSTKSAEEGGNINLRNEQTEPFNIFLSRKELAEELGADSKINIIFSDKVISNEQWLATWQSRYSGLDISPHAGGSEITSSRVFLQADVVETLCRKNPSLKRLHSYLANHLRSDNGGDIPYSFVTAVEEYEGYKLEPDEVILSDYSANRLGVTIGDVVTVSYFVAEDLKSLSTDSLTLRVKAILPLGKLHQDKGLSAEFPGLSDVERCSEWDSDLPIDMDLITDEDEDYWYKYKQTPKALIAYSAVAEDWASDYGTATALRSDVSAEEIRISDLQPQMFGLQLLHPREDALYAANNGVDFSSLFLALGFFIIAAALLLMYTPLLEMYTERSGEIEVMCITGFTQQRIRRKLFIEALPIVFWATIVGAICGVLYTQIILWLLEGVWQGATHTATFRLTLQPPTIIIGTIVGLILALGVVWIAIKQVFESKDDNVKKREKQDSLSRLIGYAIIAFVITIAIYIQSLSGKGSVLLSVVAGCCAMLTAIISFRAVVVWKRHREIYTSKLSTLRFNHSKLYASRNQIGFTLAVLAFGVFIVFVVGLNRRSFDNRVEFNTATGGYTLWCESSVELQHDPSTSEGRSKLGIDAEWSDEFKVLPCFRYRADDASCLNLNKVSEPTVLGVDFERMTDDRFALGKNIYNTSNPKEIFESLAKPLGNGVYPALVDATVLQWSIVKELGDTLYYKQHDGRELAIVLSATLSGGLFQGSILIDKDLFKQAWPENNGCDLFLVGTGFDEQQLISAKQTLSQSLYEYGMLASRTSERLAMYNEVTDTYLSIFMTLGSIGLLLGIFSLVIVVRKSLTRDRANIQNMLLMGFNKTSLQRILYRENVVAPVYAISTGFIGAIIGIGEQYANVNIIIWLSALLIAIILLYLTSKFINNEVAKAIAYAEKTLNNKDF